jgi:flagellum-specific peptidoglycan hydrolase FlgJ
MRKLPVAVYTGLLATSLALGYCPRKSAPNLEQTVTTSAAEQVATPDPAIRKENLNTIVGKYKLPQHVHEYLVAHIDDALALEKEYKVPAAAALAKAGVEHGYHEDRELITNAQNHFGIKCTPQFANDYPECYTKETWESVRGRKRVKKADFVKYVNAQESYLHFGKFLKERKIGTRKPYASVMRHTDNPQDFLEALAKSSYSTDPGELRKTMWMLRTYHLPEIIDDVKKLD